MKKFFGKIYDYFKEFGNLTPIAFVTAFLPIVGGTTLLIFALPLGEWLRANAEIGVGAYLVGVMVLCGLAILTTNIIGTLGGWAFGFETGIAVLMAGIVGAAMLSFLVHTRLVGERLPQTFAKHPKAQAIYQALLEQKFWRVTLIILLLRLSPAMPFALTNFLMASARVPFKSFVLGTLFGMLPRSAAVVFVGSRLSELRFDDSTDSRLLVVGIVATVVSMIVIGTISKRALENLTDAKQTA